MKFKLGWVKSAKKQGESTSGSIAYSWVKLNGIFYIESSQESSTDLTEPTLDQLGGAEPGKALSSCRMSLCGLSLGSVLDYSISVDVAVQVVYAASIVMVVVGDEMVVVAEAGLVTVAHVHIPLHGTIKWG